MSPEDILKKHNFSGYVHLLIPAMEEYALCARIQERKDHIYVLQQDLLDHGPEGDGVYLEDYRKCMADEILNHLAYIQDLEKELNKFITNGK